MNIYNIKTIEELKHHCWDSRCKKCLIECNGFHSGVNYNDVLKDRLERIKTAIRKEKLEKLLEK